MTDDALEVVAGPDDPDQHLRRRGPRPAGGSPTAGRRRASTTRGGRRSRCWTTTSRRWWPRPARRCGSPRRSSRSTTTTSPSGRTIVDFGQNLVGRLRVTADGPEGAEVLLRHAEILEDGELCTEPLRDADARDRLIVRGARAGDVGAPVHVPRVPLRRGQRPRRPRSSPRSATPTCAAPAGSSAPTSGSTACTRTWCGACGATSSTSHRLPAARRAPRAGPATSPPSPPPPASSTTSPASSRPGWPTWRPSRPTTASPWSCPTSSATCACAPRVWGDAATEVPWTAYQRYGDVGLLEAQYPSMRRWLETILAHTDAPGHWEEPLPPRRLAGPRRPAGQPRRRAHRRRPGRQRLVLPHGRAHGRGGRAARRGRGRGALPGRRGRRPRRTSPPATCTPTGR